MSVSNTISRPYAKAIFDYSVENNSIEEWKEILIFINEIASSKRVKRFLSGALSPKYLSLIFIKISGDLANKNVKNLIYLLAENQRFNILNEILERFLELEACYRNIIVVELRSASSLKEEQIVEIREILEQFFLKKVKFICRIDHHILGGIIIKANDTVFDLSIQNHLKQLSDVLNF